MRRTVLHDYDGCLEVRKASENCLDPWTPPADATSAMTHGGDSRFRGTIESDDQNAINPFPSAAFTVLARGIG